MESISEEHLASLFGGGLYSYIANSQHSKPFHDFAEKTVKNLIGEHQNPYMDSLMGKHHRWKHGHDILDIRGTKEINHLLTDILTKDGLPLPAMSKNYLGSGMVDTLKSFGVESPIKWLNMNGFDHLFGGLSALEAGHDISQALSSEEIDFTWETAFDTFGEGSLKIIFGLETFNPILLASGVTEYVAGSVLIYKDIARDNLPIYEQIINNIPSQAQLVSAIGFYLMISSLKNYIFYKNGKISKEELKHNTITDVSVSLGTFAITKSLITTMAVGGATGGMLLPLLIGGGTSLLLREVFTLAFPNNKILITENELWEQSPFQYDSPWNKASFENSNIWQDNIFDNGSIWQKNLFKA